MAAAISIYNTIVHLLRPVNLTFRLCFITGFYIYFFSQWTYYRLRALWIVHKTKRSSSERLEMVQKSDGAFAQMPNVMDNVVFLLSSTPDVDTVRKDLWDKMVVATDDKGQLKFPKFSRILENFDGIPFWKEAKLVNPEDHVFSLLGNTPNTEDELKYTLCDLYDAPLPEHLPKWQFIFIPLGGDFLKDSIGCCLVIRLSHFIADGPCLFRLLSEKIADQHHPLTVNTVQRFFKDGEPISDKLPSFIEGILEWPFVSLAHIKKDWTNLLHGPQLSGSPLTTWAKFDLSYVKAISKVTNTTINDICLSCLAAAYKNYFALRKAKLPKNLLSMNSITAHKVKVGDPLVLTNLVATGIMDMAVHVDDPIGRLRETKREADRLKFSPLVLLDFWAFQYLYPYVPAKNRVETFNICNAVTVITTNVAGPQHLMELFGQKVHSIMPIHILLDGIGMSVVFMGYNNSLVVNFCVDKVLMKQDDVEIFKNLFVQEMDELQKCSQGVST